MDEANRQGGEKADATPAWRRIADDLAAHMQRGDYDSGEALPAAQDLARRYGVHRHTVRQACLHLQDLGMITIRRGSGAYFTGLRMPYRLGRRVRLRDNLRAFDVAIAGTIVARQTGPCGEALARDLGLGPAAPVWRIEIVNRANAVAISSSLHALCATRFPDAPERLAAHGQSFTAAFASYGVLDYERKSTRVTARLASPDEARRLGVSVADPVLATRSIDITPDGVPLQVVDGAFRADQIELLVDNE